MQYNFHNAKYKMSDIGGIRKEQFREYEDETKYKNDVNPDRSYQNLYQEMVPDGCNWFKQIREAKAKAQEITGRAIRKDAIVLCSTVETVPSSWSADAVKEYFTDKAVWYGNYLHERGGCDAGCLKSLVVHLDETQPHATYAWLPIRNGSFQAKNILTRDFLRNLQKDGQNFTTGWIDDYQFKHPNEQIERLDPYTPGSERKHLSELEYKQEKVEEREQQLAYLAAAPNIKTYGEVINENSQLKEALSVKEKIIVRLQEERDKFKELAEAWKEKFTDLSHKAGRKLMEAFGFEKEVKEDMFINDFPDRNASAAIKEMTTALKDKDHRQYRVIPDHDPDTYRVAIKNNDGHYETIKGGFSSRANAEEYRRHISCATRSFEESSKLDQKISRSRQS